MNNEDVARRIAQLERELRADDPAFVARFERGCGRRHRIRDLITAALLASSVALLAAGFAAVSGALWVCGVATFLASFGVDRVRRGDDAAPASTSGMRGATQLQAGQ